MKLLRFAFLIGVVVLPAVAQQLDPSQSASTDDSMPAALAGRGVRRMPLDERATANYVTGGIAITQMYTDNIEFSTTGQLSDLSYSIDPHIALDYSSPKLSYDAAVAAGFVVNRKLNERNQATQNGAFDLSYHLSQFWVLRLDDSFRNTTGLWSGSDSAGVSSVSAGLGPVQQPNRSLFTFGHFRENTVLAELSAQFSATAYGGIRGEQTHTWFPSGASDPVVGALYGGNSYSAEMFYNHQFSRRHWGGVTVRAGRYDLSQSLGRTDTGSLLFMYAVALRPTMTLSFFGGPQLSVTSASDAVTPVPGFQRRLWSPNAGAVFSSETRKTSESLSFTHGVSNGGGLASAVTLDSADAQVAYRIARRVELGPGFAYGESTPIVSSAKFRSYSARIQSTLRLGNCSFSSGYSWDHRSAEASDTAAAANSVWVAFSFNFIRPIGR